MPAIKATSKSERYYSMMATAQAQGEYNDCTVKAFSAALDISYEEAHKQLARHGREHCEGMYYAEMERAFNDLGKRLKIIEGSEFISTYPAGHRDVLKSVTTHHPDRFPKADCWKGRTFLFFTNRMGHVACIKDGVNHDWTRGKAKRAFLIVEVLDR